MALVKKTVLGARSRAGADNAPAKPDHAAADKTAAPRSRGPAARNGARRATTVIERVDQATQELASGLGEAAAASAELQRAIEQISSSAEEAAGAAQESLGLITALGDDFGDARQRAEATHRQTEAVRAGFVETGTMVEASVAAIERNANRQLAAVDVIAALEKAAAEIAGIGQAVADVSERTSLLALNATIEAARAGEEGQGLAVVADEVRALADTSEANAGEIQSLAVGIAEEVRTVAERMRAAAVLAAREGEAARGVIATFSEARQELAGLSEAAQAILLAAAEADVAAREAQSGAEQVASAAEQQSAAAAEAQQALEQQSASLEQSQDTAEALGALAGELRQDGSSQTALEQVASAAEQLSATVQELSGAAAQILVAIEQIGRGTQAQAAATFQANAAMVQIENAAARTQERAQLAAQRATGIAASVEQGRDIVDGLVASVEAGLSETRAMIGLLGELGASTRRVEKIADNLALIAVQTSMLAVSGSVEATRAGETGRGFATVASDIRKLSSEASASAERAKDIVRLMQEQVGGIGRDLDQIASAAESEVGRNRAAIERIRLSATDLEATRGANAAIHGSAEAILRAVGEIRGGTEQIATAAEQAAAATREASVAARQQAQGAESLAAAIEEIASLATALLGEQP